MLKDPHVVEYLSLDTRQKNDLFELWNNEFPKQIQYVSLVEFERYLDKLQNLRHYIIAADFHKLQGWSFTFNRDEETWFGLIVDTAFQRMGIGTVLLNYMKANHASLNGWVTDHNKDFRQDGEPYRSPLRFYLKQEFTVHPEIRMEANNLSTVKISWNREVN